MQTIQAPANQPFLTDTAPQPDSLRLKVVAWVTRLLVAKEWLKFFRALVDAVNAASTVIGQVSLTAQSDSIAFTAIPVSDITSGSTVNNTGLYRINWYAQITQVGSVSSSLQANIRWTNNGETITLNGAAETGNALDTYISGSELVKADVNSSIEYEVIYAADIANSMEYELTIAVERIG